MKIQKGKVAILLLALILVIPVLKGIGSIVEERAMNACTATPTSEPDSENSVEFSWSTLGWVCHETLTDKDGKPIGDTTDTHLPLFP